MTKTARTSSITFVLAAICIFHLNTSLKAQAPKASSLDKQRGHDIASQIKGELKKNYYDPSFHGMDLDARFKAADGKIDSAESIGHIFGIIAQALLDLEDSHTFFVPPGRSARTEYGWEMQMIGDKCLVTAVKPGSDAEAKGLREGDEVWTINGFGPSRENFWRIEYLFKALRPQPGMKLTVRRPNGKEDELVVLAKITEQKRLMDLTSGEDIWYLIRESENSDRLHRQRYVEMGNELMIWKMPRFGLTEVQVDDMMAKVRKHKSLVLDLRGNGGGYVITLQRLAGYFFDHDVKIGDRKGRKEMKPQVARTRGDKVFKGQLVVLIDSRSASAAELFARLVQLEHRGTVVGDRSAGAVMEARFFPHQWGVDVVAFWGVSITDADVIMTDGKSLEKAGVNVDELVLPSPADLAAKRDPALARAVALLGLTLDADKAGQMFPVEWRK
ncbi:MAG TPA: S41 family peptidase [Pyrinomonadaceae bacterium]|nr:S41 family peptidase [Pyrinomonadaceae bacterium]